MAEPCKLGSFNSENNRSSKQKESLSLFNVLCVFISLVTILADLTTVLLLFAEYCNRSFYYWAIATLIYIIVPNALANIFSLRWIAIDQKINFQHWITHCFLIGLIERYVIFLHTTFWCKKNSESSAISKFLIQRNDLNLLHFLYIFTGTVPQIILQTYAIITLEGNNHTIALSLCASITSVSWACTTYIHSSTSVDNEQYRWLSVLLKTVWHFGMLIARVAGILLFTVVFGVWTLVPMGIHWAAMTFWIVTQKTTFCPNKFEETLYNVVMGFIYCFSYINLREGHTRFRLLMFYSLMITQNFGSLFLFILISPIDNQNKMWSIMSTVCIVVGTIVGICSMLLYYRWFHAKGPILWKNVDDIELNNKATIPNLEQNDRRVHGINHVRSFKTSSKEKIQNDNTGQEVFPPESVPPIEMETADKKFLLDHWIARLGTPTFVSAPIGNDNMDVSGIEFYTVENTPQSLNVMHNIEESCTKINMKGKRKAIFSPTELSLKLSSLDNIESSIDEITTSNFNFYKRRGICSSDELKEDFQELRLDSKNANCEQYSENPKNDHSSDTNHDDGSHKKTSSDSIDMDLDLSFSDINSSDINTFNENIVQKLCLSALKNIKVGNQDADIQNIQRIALDILKEMYAKKGKNKYENADLLSETKRDLDTPTEMLSVHDYENICAVNIAREAWGLRSWNGYSDIENWIHDGSVFRDRRHDTLTSSSEISSCLSQELKNSILSAPPFPSKRTPTYSNILVKCDKNNQQDYVNTSYNCPTTSDDTSLNKPCLVDNKDFSHLEPITEELDDFGDIDPPNKMKLNSESSLVATIDEIRKANVTNSPRNVYHRREYVWDSPQLNTSTKLESNLKRALWKEPSKFNSSNIMQSLPEKENMFNSSHVMKIVQKKELNVQPTYLDMSGSHRKTREIIEIKCTKRRQKSINLRTQVKKVNNKPDIDHDLYNKDIDFLWQLVSDNSLSSHTNIDLSTNQITSSLQSLIIKDGLSTPILNVTGTSKNLNTKKPNRSRARRKFSILRERFEPKPNKSSDEEVLYQYSDNINSQQLQSTSVVVNVKNEFESDRHTHQKQINTRGSEVLQDEASFSKEIGVPSTTSKSIKEKRSQFMKQVLNPPKFNTKLKHKY